MNNINDHLSVVSAHKKSGRTVTSVAFLSIPVFPEKVTNNLIIIPGYNIFNIKFSLQYPICKGFAPLYAIGFPFPFPVMVIFHYEVRF